MNRQKLPSLLWVALLTAVLTAPAAAQVEVRRIERTLYPGTATTVHADLTVGSLAIEGTDGRDVEVEVLIECRLADVHECRARAEQIVLRPRVKKGKLVVKLTHTPRARIKGLKALMWLRVPNHLILDVNVSAGGVRVQGMSSHIEIDTLAGDVDLTYRYQRAASVDVDVAFGRAELLLPEGRVQGAGFPRSIDWVGSGQTQIKVDVGTGDATIRLE